MLVLSRKKNEKLVIRYAGKVIEVTVVESDRRTVRLGVVADNDVKINRSEIDAAIHGQGGSNADRK